MKVTMKAYEFPAKVTPEGKLELPDALVKLLSDNGMVRVLILVTEPDDLEDEAAWSRFTAEQFFAGYAEIDSVYDKL